VTDARGRHQLAAASAGVVGQRALVERKKQLGWGGAGGGDEPFRVALDDGDPLVPPRVHALLRGSATNLWQAAGSPLEEANATLHSTRLLGGGAEDPSRWRPPINRFAGVDDPARPRPPSRAAASPGPLAKLDRPPAVALFDDGASREGGDSRAVSDLGSRDSAPRRPRAGEAGRLARSLGRPGDAVVRLQREQARDAAGGLDDSSTTKGKKLAAALAEDEAAAGARAGRPAAAGARGPAASWVMLSPTETAEREWFHFAGDGRRRTLGGDAPRLAKWGRVAGSRVCDGMFSERRWDPDDREDEGGFYFYHRPKTPCAASAPSSLLHLPPPDAVAALGPGALRDGPGLGAAPPPAAPPVVLPPSAPRPPAAPRPPDARAGAPGAAGAAPPPGHVAPAPLTLVTGQPPEPGDDAPSDADESDEEEPFVLEGSTFNQRQYQTRDCVFEDTDKVCEAACAGDWAKALEQRAFATCVASAEREVATAEGRLHAAAVRKSEERAAALALAREAAERRAEEDDGDDDDDLDSFEREAKERDAFKDVPDEVHVPPPPAPPAEPGAGQESEIPNFKGSSLGRFPLVSADFWTSDHLLERSRSVDAFSGTRARGTLTLNHSCPAQAEPDAVFAAVAAALSRSDFRKICYLFDHYCALQALGAPKKATRRSSRGDRGDDDAAAAAAAGDDDDAASRSSSSSSDDDGGDDAAPKGGDLFFLHEQHLLACLGDLGVLGQATAAQARLGDAQARSIFRLATGAQATRRRGNVTATTTFLPGADKGGLGLAPSQRGGQGVILGNAAAAAVLPGFEVDREPSVAHPGGPGGGDDSQDDASHGDASTVGSLASPDPRNRPAGSFDDAPGGDDDDDDDDDGDDGDDDGPAVDPSLVAAAALAEGGGGGLITASRRASAARPPSAEGTPDGSEAGDDRPAERKKKKTKAERQAEAMLNFAMSTAGMGGGRDRAASGDVDRAAPPRLDRARFVEVLVRVALQLYMGLKPPPRPAKAMAMLLQQVALRAPRAALEPRDGFRSSLSGQDKGDSSSLQREWSARARSGKSIHASRALREMIARPKISRCERKTTERGAFDVGNFAPFRCPGRSSTRGTSSGASAPTRASSSASS